MNAPGAGAALPREAARKPRPAGAVKKLPAAMRQHSQEAKQRAAVILEVLAGGRTPTDAAAALGLSLGRYYLLEDTALVGLLAACEAQRRGQRPDSARRLAALEHECARWRREAVRQQALVRAAQRTIGLAPPPASPVKTKGKRRRRPVVRALSAAQRLRQDAPAAAVASTAAAASS
jgi:hypothetical protein